VGVRRADLDWTDLARGFDAIASSSAIIASPVANVSLRPAARSASASRSPACHAASQNHELLWPQQDSVGRNFDAEQVALFKARRYPYFVGKGQLTLCS
jgi:hypothetical protein